MLGSGLTTATRSTFLGTTDEPATHLRKASNYDRRFGYVAAFGAEVLELLAPGPGETVLDLGCGTGELTAAIRERGADAIGIDHDPAMVAVARERVGDAAVLVADGQDFTLDEPVDAVFSNAALHWMPRQEQVITCVRRALRPGGRFVAELGGAGNVASVRAALAAALTEAGLETPPNPWYFPTTAQHASLLEAGGFRVVRIEHFPRPTPLRECPDGVVDWLRMFGESLTAHVPPGQVDGVLQRVSELTGQQTGRPWIADYWRLRFVAVAAPAEPA